MSASAHETELERLLATAAEWHARLSAENASAALRIAFEEWLSAASAHRDAYARVATSLQRLEELATDPEMLVMRREALDRALSVGRTRTAGRQWRWPAAAAAAVLVAIALVVTLSWTLWPHGPTVQVDEAGPSERRIVTLPDRSQVTIDASSRLAVRYSRSVRSLELLEGQARFLVAHGDERPFVVIAAGESVTAHGTVFNIDLMSDRVAVTLIEGKVRVATADDDSRRPRFHRPVDMLPAQQLVIGPEGRATLRSPVDLTAISAWEQGKLVFDDEPLSTALQRVNRYSQQQIAVSGAATGELRISGVFDTGDLRAFAEGAAARLSLEVSERDGGNFVLARRE